MKIKEAELMKARELNCTIHEDECGFLYLVPHWAVVLFGRSK